MWNGIAAIGLENVSKQHPSESRFQRWYCWVYYEHLGRLPQATTELRLWR
jgi:hypothetical protein